MNPQGILESHQHPTVGEGKGNMVKADRRAATDGPGPGGHPQDTPLRHFFEGIFIRHAFLVIVWGLSLSALLRPCCHILPGPSTSQHFLPTSHRHAYLRPSGSSVLLRTGSGVIKTSARAVRLLGR